MKTFIITYVVMMGNLRCKSVTAVRAKDEDSAIARFVESNGNQEVLSVTAL